MEFKDELRELFLKLHKNSPELFDDKNTRGKETFLTRLARAFECDPTVKKPPKVKNAALNGPIRTIRHMIYNHDTIKGDLDSEGQKKILIPFRSRLQILLAKRLSTLRIIKEQREHILTLANPDLEELLIMEDQGIKAKLSKGIAQEDPIHNEQNPLDPHPVWKRDGRQIYRLRLTPGVALEIDSNRYHPENSKSNETALAKYLEVMFHIEPGSETSNELIAQVIKATRPPSG